MFDLTVLVFLCAVKNKMGFPNLFDTNVSVNVSNQSVEQSNYSYQLDSQAISNNTKEENMQDYMTYIRMSNRNLTDMKKNFKANLEAVMDMSNSNEIDLTACTTFLDTVDIKQTNDIEARVENGLKALQNSIDKIKQANKGESSTTTTADQGATSSQSAEGETDQSSTQSADASQEVDQTSFTVVGRISPVRVSENFKVMMNAARRNGRRQQAVKLSNQGKRKEGYRAIRGPGFASTGEMYIKAIRNGAVKESLFSIDVGVNVSNQNIKQDNVTRQESQKILNNNTEIANKISSAYDKVAEVLNETKINEDKAAEAKAEAKVRNENVFKAGISPKDYNEMMKTAVEAADKGLKISPCQLVFEKSLNATQENKVRATVILNGIIEQISSTDLDNEVQAIMADMMGLTQSAEAEEKAKAATKQAADQKAKAEQVATQSAGQMSIAAAIVLIVMLLLLYKMISGGPHPWFLEQVDKVINAATNPNNIAAVTGMMGKMGAIPGPVGLPKGLPQGMSGMPKVPTAPNGASVISNSTNTNNFNGNTYTSNTSNTFINGVRQ